MKRPYLFGRKKVNITFRNVLLVVVAVVHVYVYVYVYARTPSSSPCTN